MKQLVLLGVVLSTVLPTVLAAQVPLKPRAAPIPATVRAWVGELANICTDAGGKLARSPNLVSYVDLTGDGVTDYIVDAGAFNCDGAASALTNGQSGANLSVFAGGPANTASKAYSASVYLHQLDTKGPVPRLYVGLSGPDCGQRNAANLPFSQVDFCLRPLTWVSARRTFVLAPLSQKRPFPAN